MAMKKTSIDSPVKIDTINPNKFTQPTHVKLRDLGSWNIGGGSKKGAIIDSPMHDDNKKHGKKHY